jgi:hypothetical protein
MRSFIDWTLNSPGTSLLTQTTCVFINTAVKSSYLAFTFSSTDEILLKLSKEAGNMRGEWGVEITVFVLKLQGVLSVGKLTLRLLTGYKMYPGVEYS